MSPDKVINGVNLTELAKSVRALKDDADLAKFRFRVRNRWKDGGKSTTSVVGFYGTGQEHRSGEEPFELRADEPEVLLGTDTAPNPVEHLLNALVTCLTTSMVFHAASRGITISELESTVEGDLDIRGFLGISDEIRKGYQNITVAFKVKADAPEEKLMECARFSPVFDVVTNGTSVDLSIEKE